MGFFLKYSSLKKGMERQDVVKVGEPIVVKKLHN